MTRLGNDTCRCIGPGADKCADRAACLRYTDPIERLCSYADLSMEGKNDDGRCRFFIWDGCTVRDAEAETGSDSIG